MDYFKIKIGRDLTFMRRNRSMPHLAKSKGNNATSSLLMGDRCLWPPVFYCFGVRQIGLKANIVTAYICDFGHVT